MLIDDGSTDATGKITLAASGSSRSWLSRGNSLSQEVLQVWERVRRMRLADQPYLSLTGSDQQRDRHRVFTAAIRAASKS